MWQTRCRGGEGLLLGLGREGWTLNEIKNCDCGVESESVM